MATNIGAEFANNVALATLVLWIDKCQKVKSPAKSTPVSISSKASLRLLTLLVPVPSKFNQRTSAGTARAGRYRAVANGPSSLNRTNIGDAPTALAPRISAVSARRFVPFEESFNGWLDIVVKRYSVEPVIVALPLNCN